jgi:hypothetical protein
MEIVETRDMYRHYFLISRTGQPMLLQCVRDLRKLS